MLTLHSREHRFLFSYLLLATALLAGLAGWVLYRNYSLQTENVGHLTDKLKRQQQLFEEQKNYLPLLDSAHQAIAAYRPEVTAVFMEADIENQLNDIRRLYIRRMYTTNDADDTVRFFRAFNQVADFYRMLYLDKKILADRQSNVKSLVKQLTECKIDFQAKAPSGTSAPTVAPSAALPLAAPLTTPLATPPSFPR
jgi:hypothetical protein